MQPRIMTTSKKAITIPKYSGASDDVPFDKWLRLFEVKTAAAAWTERDKLCNFSDYLEGEAFRWYLTEVFDTGTAWEDLVACMTERFASAIADPFRQFIHCRLKSGQSLKEYYDEKMCLGRLAELKDAHLISGLIDGLPAEMEMALAGLTPSTPAAWLLAALRVEAAMNRAKSHRVPPGRHAQINAPSGNSYQRPPNTPGQAHMSECRHCAMAGLPRQMHWHNECPRRASISALATNQGNEEGDPKLC